MLSVATTPPKAAPSAAFLTKELKAAVDAAPADPRAAVAGCLRAAFDEARMTLSASLSAGGNPLKLAHGYSKFHDAALTALFRVGAVATDAPRAGKKLSLIALGGYGRGALAPQSDVDILFLIRGGAEEEMTPLVEFILYTLWDLRLVVGHAVRDMSNTISFAKEDMTARTALIDARRVCGGAELAQELHKKVDAAFVRRRRGEFVDAKFDERGARIARAVASRYLVEPNVKEGKGGLRDLQLLRWIAKASFGASHFPALADEGVITKAEARRFVRAQNFLWAVRSHIHDIRKRPDDRLTFAIQPEVARRLKYADRKGMPAAERLMRHYFLVARDVGVLVRRVSAALEEEGLKRPLKPGASVRAASDAIRRDKSNLRVLKGRVDFVRPRLFIRKPSDIMRLFQVVDAYDLDIHPNAFAAIAEAPAESFKNLKRDEDAQDIFRRIMTQSRNPERVLRLMNETGVLGRFIPAFGRLAGRVRYGLFYSHTLDEHAIRAVGVLSAIERGDEREEHPVATEAVSLIENKTVLYFAVLFHVLRYSGPRKTKAGAGALAERIGRRFGLSKEDAVLLGWVVESHADLARVAECRDLTDIKGVADFASSVGSLTRLRFLLIVTVCSLKIAGPQSWDGWMRHLLQDLHTACEAYLQGGGEAALADAFARQAATRRREVMSAFEGRPAPERQRIKYVCDGFDEAFWGAFSAEALARYVEAVLKSQKRDEATVIDVSAVESSGVTEAFIYTDDQPGLFGLLAGALAACGVSIRGARAVTAADGKAADVFVIQDLDGAPIDDSRRLEEIRGRLAAAIRGELRLRPSMFTDRIGARTDLFDVPVKVRIENAVSDRFTVIEAECADRPGLLYELSEVLGEAGVTIHSAHVATYGERAVDVFYIEDVPAHKITNARRLEGLRRRVLSVLNAGEGGGT
ncbi:MAG: [protein-PII] uridylyltransferase [Pseudomonadota bacterium]